MAAGDLGAVPTLPGTRIPLSLVSLVTLTVQNSALAILLHYSRTAKDAKPYSAAAAVLLNELLKGTISLGIALSNVESASQGPGAARYSGDAAAAPLMAGHGLSRKDRPPSLSLAVRSGDSTPKRLSPTTATFTYPAVKERAWWLSQEQWQYRMSQVTRAIFSPDCWKLAVPACCYVLQNNLQFVAASNLDVATFQVTYQMKILTTAFFSVTMLRKSLSLQKWMCLLGLAAGVAIVQLQGVSSTANSSHGANMDRMTGFVAVTMACFTSGFAGVYFEKVLKGSSADLWVRNVQLTLFSLPPAILPAFFPDFSLSSLWNASQPLARVADPNAPTWLFGNFGGWALATVACQCFGGLVTALVIRYSDNIAKGFATSLSIIISFVAGVLLFGNAVTLPFVVGGTIVLGATYMYNLPDKSGPSAPLYKAIPLSPLPEQDESVNAFAVDMSQNHSIHSESAVSQRHGHAPMLSPVVPFDPNYPFAPYPNKAGRPPQFSNLSPFLPPSNGEKGSEGFPIPAHMLEDGMISPKSPVPNGDSPFVPSFATMASTSATPVSQRS